MIDLVSMDIDVPILELSGVAKAYFADASKSRIRLAHDGKDHRVMEGEFVCLLGPSGSGKTVTLNLLAGFERPTAGETRFKGELITQPGPERGVVFQDFSLLPWLSVQGNIDFALRAQGVQKSERETRVYDALRIVGLLDHAQDRPNLLSGGMKQRVAIARLLALDSEAFLMDEPFSALDEQNRLALDDELFELWRAKRKTIVFVTHSISEAIRLGSRIVLFSSSPATIIREWDLGNRLSGELTAADAKHLHDQISELLAKERQ